MKIKKTLKIIVAFFALFFIIQIESLKAEAIFNEEKSRPYTEEEVYLMLDNFEKVHKQADKEFERIAFDSNNLYSENCCLMEKDTGKILYAFAEDTLAFPASLTKIMTTIVAIDSLKNLNESYIFTQKKISDLVVQDASMAGFAADEKVTAKDLIYGTMLPSGGEAAEGLAECASNSVTDHVKKMNDKLKDYGLSKSNFTNVTGLHNKDNVSTAREIAEMVRYGLNNKEFRDVFTNQVYVTSKTAQHPDGVELKYSVIKYQDLMEHQGFKILGGKTGYTEEANLCLASIAEVKGKEYILVTLGAPIIETNGATHFTDAFTCYKMLYQNTN